MITCEEATTIPKFIRETLARADPGWAAAEFGDAELGDLRRTASLVKMVGAMSENPGGSIPETSAGWAATKAAYRLLDAPETTFESVLEAHRASTLRRAGEGGEPVVLAVQDTTTLDFSGRAALDGLGATCAKGSTRGLLLHNSLLLGADGGEVYGLVGARLYARDPEKRKAGPKGKRNREPVSEKESGRWLEGFEMARAAAAELRLAHGAGAPVVVSVGDREADIYELLLEGAAHRDAGVELLVRAQHNRALERGEARLWDGLAEAPAAGEVTVGVPCGKGLKRRDARLEVRYKKVELSAPADKRKYLGIDEAVEMYAIELREPGGEIHWKLLTTVPIGDVAKALEVAGWYARRWTVEVLHRVLKTGCRVEKRQLRKMDRMRPMVAIDLVVACYVMSLASAARTRPEQPAERWLGGSSCEALLGHRRGTGSPGSVPDNGPDELTVGEAVAYIAKLGGHLGRKGDGPPGAEVIWRGLAKLEAITEAWEIFKVSTARSG